MKRIARTIASLAVLLSPAAAQTSASTKPTPTLLPPGPLHTAGSQIVDKAGKAVRLACVGLYDANFRISMQVQARIMVAAGFNCIRMSWVNATKEKDLATIDRVIAAVADTGLRLILDNHTNEAGTPADGYGAQQKNGLWYDVGGLSDSTNGAGVPGTVTDRKFLADWVTVARHYAGNDIVIGFDLRNEPLHYRGQCTWGDGNIDSDIRLMYQRVGNAIQEVDVAKLIIAEGPQNWKSSFADLGPAPEGDLTLAKSKPVVLNTPNKVVYSVHEYPNYHPNSGPVAIARMNYVWGYLISQNIAPVWIGEMGASLDGNVDAGENLSSQRAWITTLLPYLNGHEGMRGGPTFTEGQQAIGTDWWAWGNFEGDSPDGTLENDWSTLRPGQAAAYSQLRQIVEPELPVGLPPGH
ncbi:MAG: cellulase family glycosylhydrolase [Rhodopila sp.]|nr:cellulase family glycosylhydrolase [Rhodopila sp.]